MCCGQFTSHAATLKAIGRWSARVPSTPLFLPQTRHSEAARLLSSFWNVSTTSNSKSETFARNCLILSLRAALEATSTPPVVRTKSSATNLSITSGLRPFQTAALNTSRISTERRWLIPHSPLTREGRMSSV
jgi:hypothetical protein